MAVPRRLETRPFAPGGSRIARPRCHRGAWLDTGRLSAKSRCRGRDSVGHRWSTARAPHTDSGEAAVVVADVSAAAGWPELVDLTVPNEAMDGYDVAIAYDPATFGSVLDERSLPSRAGSRHATCSWQRCTSTNHVH